MISFLSFPVPPDYTTANSMDTDADFDDDDFEAGVSKVTCPGESITSAQAFMRYLRK